MADRRFAVAQILAATALGLALTNRVAGTELLLADLIAAVAVSMPALGVAAFVSCREGWWWVKKVICDGRTLLLASPLRCLQ